MARLFNKVGTSFSFRAKTHDEDDTAMRERGATGVFRNVAFQEGVEEPVMTPHSKMATPSTPHKKNIFAASNDASTPVGTPKVDCEQMWASPPHTPLPANAKRAVSQPACPTPRSNQRLSAVKRAKNFETQIEEIVTGDQELGDDKCCSDAGLVKEVVNTPKGGHGPGYGLAPAVRLWEEEVKRLVASGRQEDALRWAAPSDGMIRCTVRRVKNFLGQTLAYQLFLDSGDTFLLAARKRKKSKTSNYVLSTSQDDLYKNSQTCVAKLRANFIGTEYSLSGRYVSTSVSGAEDEAAVPEHFSTEELAVHYKQTVLTAKGGPRVMLIATPLPESNWNNCAQDGSDSLTHCLDAARRRELPPRLERQLCMLATRPPEWDTALKAYTLDFHGRVRASSVKNFQLVHWDHNTDRKGADLVLQFGKIDEGSEDFALDFTYPLTLQKAFGIALASTDSKLCYAL